MPWAPASRKKAVGRQRNLGLHCNMLVNTFSISCHDCIICIITYIQIPRISKKPKHLISFFFIIPVYLFYYSCIYIVNYFFFIIYPYTAHIFLKRYTTWFYLLYFTMINSTHTQCVLLLSVDRYRCWWTICHRVYHPPSIQCPGSDMVY